MSRFRVTLSTAAFLTIEVDAVDEEAAIHAAYQETPSEVCAQCSGWRQSWSFEINPEWDLRDPTATAVQP